MLGLYLFNALLAITTVAAMIWGGGPERWTAFMFLLAALATIFVQPALTQLFQNVELGVLLIDLLLLAALVVLALKADRHWPMWAVALHFTAILAHAVKGIDAETIRWVYQMLLRISSYGTQFVLLGGIIRHQQRLARNGTDKSWSS